LHNVSNALAAAALAQVLGMNHADITDGLSVFELAPMRLEMHTTMSGITLINDAYSSDPVSARSALATLQHYSQGTRSVAILGDMLDLGTLSSEAHRELGKDVVAFGVSQLVTLGPLSLNTAAAAADAGMPPEHITRCHTLDELSEVLEILLEPGDVVLFKGSRAMQVDRAAERLLESVAPTRLYVDLGAIQQNVQALKTHLHGTRLMAVVKSFAYGNDATRVSQTLVREGIDALAVAYADEAIPLRRRGLKVPILVTNTLAPEADKIVKYDLTALISSIDALDALQRHAARRNAHVRVHIEVDSGMGRVGLIPHDVLSFAKECIARPNVILEGLMTHFASADDATQDDFTRLQIARFEEVIQELGDAGIHPKLIHAANTAGAWRFPESHYDMVRVGLGLYGFHPSNEVAPIASDTRPALKFATQIIHIKDVHKGDSISYGRTWISQDTRRIATIAVGYNDGFSRFMSNGGEVLVQGVRCPVVGTVCMDVCMVDITAVPDATVGDEVVLFGSQGNAHISVEEMATRGNTINYEILCKISPRVRRIFLQ
jgi:alanine racemase